MDSPSRIWALVRPLATMLINQEPQAALAEIPTVCDAGMELNSQSHKTVWIGYRAHFAVDDAGPPITVLTTSASLHGSSSQSCECAAACV